MKNNEEKKIIKMFRGLRSQKSREKLILKAKMMVKMKKGGK